MCQFENKEVVDVGDFFIDLCSYVFVHSNRKHITPQQRTRMATTEELRVTHALTTIDRPYISTLPLDASTRPSLLSLLT